MWVRRAACGACRASHALLPDFIVHRRRDSVVAIGAALAAGAGVGGDVTLWAAVPPRTVRSWRHRFGSRRDLLIAGLTAVAATLGPAPVLPLDRGPTAVAIAAVGAAWWAASERAPGRVPGPWRLADVIIGSHLLSTRVGMPWAVVGSPPGLSRGP